MTAQQPDEITVEGEVKMGLCSLASDGTCSLPLDSWFDLNGSKPPKDEEYWNTSNSRGYVASWKVEDNKLFLVNVQSARFYENGEHSHPDDNYSMAKLFPGEDTPRLASWFTGELRVPEGEMLEYVHAGFISQYERDLFIEVEKGQVVNRRLVDNTKTEVSFFRRIFGLKKKKKPEPTLEERVKGVNQVMEEYRNSDDPEERELQKSMDDMMDKILGGK